MTPSHSNTRNRRYRYYVSQALIQGRKNEAGYISKIPSGEIETVVIEEIKKFLSNSKNIHKYIAHYDVHKQKELISLIKSHFDTVILRSILSKIVLYKEKIEIVLCKNQLLKVLDAIIYEKSFPEELKNETDEPILITKNIKITQVSRIGSKIIISDSQNKPVFFNKQLIKAIAKSFYWNKLLDSGEAKSSVDIQKMENLTDNTYIKDVLNLRFLAPDIVENILNGTQPSDTSVLKLLKIKTLDWQEQRKLLSM